MVCSRLAAKQVEALKVKNKPMQNYPRGMGLNFLLLSAISLAAFIIYSTVGS